ncbi:hypothetical protein SMQC21_27110 [Serratia marcescens]|nr:hypothetical protein SMQC21_27110 [Serratia marcescens]
MWFSSNAHKHYIKGCLLVAFVISNARHRLS